MQISVQHQISVALGENVGRAVQHLLLTPQSGPTQTVREWRVEVEGLDDPQGFMDAYGNRALLASQTRPPAELVIAVSGVVETHDRHGVLGRIAGEPVPALFRRTTPLAKPIGAIVSRLRALPRNGADRIPLLHTLMARVGEVLAPAEATQSQSQETGGQSQSQSQSAGNGSRSTASATDHAHAFIGAARALDIPARYVSGYLYGDDAPAAGPHGWAEAWDDGLGWIGFDPLLAICPTDRHVRVATGLDALSAVPVRSVPVVGSPADLKLVVSAGQ